MTASSSGSRLPDSFRSEWSPLHSLKPACTHHAYCSQQVPPQSTRAPQWYLTKSKASLIGTSVAIFAHGVEAITLFWQHSVSSVLAFPPLSLSPFPLIPENVYLPFYTGERCLQRFPALPADGDVFPMHFYQTTLSLPVMRRHIRTSRFVFFVFAGAFLRYYSGEPLFAHENYSGILRRVSCTSLHLINIPEYANDVSCSGWAPVSPKCGSEISPWSRQFCYENIDSRYYLLCCNWYYFLLVFFCNLLFHIFIALVHGQRM